MSKEHENRLAQAASAYLRSARHQPVDWHEWSDEAFTKAGQQDKPVLLDVGAVWCHWCHVMDRESYESPEIAALINEFFVAVKVDRDERPDVDARYQAAVSAISGQGGWPLTAFLTPEGKPYFGGTYFPPEDRYGRPSFARVLRSMAEAYRSQRAEVNESADSVVIAIDQNETFSGRGGELGEPLLDRIMDSMLSQFDPRNGGFGSQPKFPHPGALDLLIDAATRPGQRAARAREFVELTLQRMAAGGLHDQLAGGFHRYSVDESWVVPHFEKMAYDNSELLRVYAHAFQSFVDPQYARVAGKTLGWMDAWLTDREHGGFYASQDADESMDDDGDYFTWTRAEAEAVLSPEQLAVAESYYHLRPVGHMHHNPAKNVLHVIGDVPGISARLGKTEAEIDALLRSAQDQLYAARLKRRTPYVDRTVYTGWNGLCISAYLAAGRALGLPDAVAFALKSLDRVLAIAWKPDSGLSRVVSYGEGGSAASGVPAVLDDYAFLGIAALDGWEATGEVRYFEAARQLADHLLLHFYDPSEGGFFDTASQGGPKLGALTARRKPLQDSPTPAGNPMAATLLLRLHTLTEEPTYRQRAVETLEAFGGIVEHFGLYAGAYGQALRHAISAPVQVSVVGEDALANELEATAMARFLFNKSVVRLRTVHLDTLPPSLATTVGQVPGIRESSQAVVCRSFSCLPPLRDADALLRVVTEEI